MKENFIPLLTGIIFLIIGVICLFWPEKVQEYALKWSAQGLGRFNPFLGWMKTGSYIFALRVIGVMAIGTFILAIFVVFKGTQR